MNLQYPFEIRSLAREEGGGYLIRFPDLPGCISDGETLEALQNGADTLTGWLETRREQGLLIPPPYLSDTNP